MKQSYLLEVVQGRLKGQVFRLTRRETVLGRGDAADVNLEDPEASRRHCLITENKGVFRVEDQGSANGVFVNDRQVQSAELTAGDMIRVGNTELRLSAAESGGDQKDEAEAAGPRRPLRLELQARLGALSWPTTILCLMLAAAVIGHALATRPLLSAQRDMIEDNALRRAKVLTLALAAMNREALRLGDEMLLETDSVAEYEGVLEVYVYDRQGRILAPLSRFHEAPTDLGTMRAVQTETQVVTERAPGIYDLAEPIRVYNQATGKFDKIGTARIVFSVRQVAEILESGGQRSSWITLIFLLLGAGVLTKALDMAASRRIAKLRDDVEGVLKGDRPELRPTYGMAALDRLAASVGRCLIKLSSGPISAAAAPGDKPSGAPLETQEDSLSRLLVEASLDGILVADGRNEVVLANAECERILGVDRGGLTGRHFFEAVGDQQMLGALVRLVQEALTSEDSRAVADVTSGLGAFRIRVAVSRDGTGQDEYRQLIVAMQAAERQGGDSVRE